MAASDLPGLALAVANRVRGAPYNGPWMVPGAVAFINHLLDKNVRLLELGSGRSTVWYASRCAYVLSIEPNRTWMSSTQKALRALCVHNTELVNTSIERALMKLRDEGASFDFVVVDSTDEKNWTRVHCVELAQTLVRPGGWLVLDDSDRTAYSSVFETLSQWEPRSFRGFKQSPLVYTETTLFRHG